MDGWQEDFPVWQMPVKEKSDAHGADHRFKYHCFYKGVSMCGKYPKNTHDFMADLGVGEVLSRPELVCQICYQRWLEAFVSL